MKDKELRWKLNDLGIIRINFLTDEIRETRDTFRYSILENKVDLILQHLGLEYKTNARLEAKKSDQTISLPEPLSTGSDSDS